MLHESHVDGLPGGLNENGYSCQHREHHQPQKCSDGEQPRSAGHAHKCRNSADAEGNPKADPESACQRQQRGQRRIHLAVAQIQPGKAAEEVTAQPLAEYPQWRNHDQAAKCRARWPDACLKPADQRRIECHQGRKDDHGGTGERRGHVAVLIEADVDPGHTHKRRAQTKDKAL